MDDTQDVTIEPAPWSRWLSCVIFKAKAPADTAARIAHSGILFDTIEARRASVAPAVNLLIQAGHALGPIVADGADAWALVPPGVHSSWSDLTLVSGAPAEEVSCCRPGSIVRLPAQEPVPGASIMWLVPPSLDVVGLPILTDPIDLLDALRRGREPSER